MAKYYYKLIGNASELKQLHEEAKKEGKLEVGLSRGKLFYIWDESIDNLRSIKADEAAARLGLTRAQVDQIINTNAEVVFDDLEEAAEVVKESTFQEEAVPVASLPGKEPETEETQTPEASEGKPAEELSTVEVSNASESVLVEADPVKEPEKEPEATPDPKTEEVSNEALIEAVDEIVAALLKFRDLL
jgi:hypothetical protein